MFEITKTLIVVYRDEMLLNQLKKMIETSDDTDQETVVGTKDGFINIVSWSEKVWLANKKGGNIKDKVLFLDDIKGTDKLIPVIDVKFDDCGVRFGWAGNQAILYADTKIISGHEDYLVFIEKLSVHPVPDMIKTPVNVKLKKISSIEKEASTAEKVQEGKKKETSLFFKKAKEVILQGTEVVGKTGAKAAVKAEELLRNKNAVKRQMLFYGIVNLYNDGLNKFMNV